MLVSPCCCSVLCPGHSTTSGAADTGTPGLAWLVFADRAPPCKPRSDERLREAARIPMLRRSGRRGGESHDDLGQSCAFPLGGTGGGGGRGGRPRREPPAGRGPRRGARPAP